MTMPPQPPAGPPPPRRRGGAAGWARAHKGAAAGAAAAGAVIIYALYRRHQNAAAAAAGTTADSTGAGGGGVQGTFNDSSQNVYDAIESQITALQEQIGQSSTNAAAAGSTAGAPAGATVTVPKVTGMKVSTAISALSAAGLTARVAARNPQDTYIVNSQTPGAGARVPAGSTVSLGIAPHRFGK